MNNNLPEISFSLFAFHLRNKLSHLDELESDANHLWQKCQELGTKLGVNELENFSVKLKTYNNQIGLTPTQENPDSAYLELLETRYLPFKTPIKETHRPQIIGSVYPLQIHDTYVVNINLRLDIQPNSNLKFKTQNFKQLNPDNFFLPENIQPSLGQTLVIYLENNQSISGEKAKRIAQICINFLLNTQKANYPLSQGTFLDNPIFEYDNGLEQPGKNLHILIWFYNEKIYELNLIQPLINLLCCRAKILFAYDESRKSYQHLTHLYQDLKEDTQVISQLRELDIQYATIETNAQNYKFWLQELEKLKPQDVEARNHLGFLQDFLEHSHAKLAKQIKYDLSYFNTVRELDTKMISSVQGMVQITQTESDSQTEDRQKERNSKLQKTVAVVAVGIGAAQIGSVVSSYLISVHPTQQSQPILPPSTTNKLNPFILSLLLALLFGGVGVILTIWIMDDNKKFPGKALLIRLRR